MHPLRHQQDLEVEICDSAVAVLLAIEKPLLLDLYWNSQEFRNLHKIGVKSKLSPTSLCNSEHLWLARMRIRR